MLYHMHRFWLFVLILDWVEQFQPDLKSDRFAFAPFDMIETSTEYHILCDLAGVDVSTLQVYVREKNLHIKGRKEEDLLAGDILLNKQRSTGKIHRRIALPSNISWDFAYTHRFRDGVLKVVFKKEVPSVTFKKVVPIEMGIDAL